MTSARKRRGNGQKAFFAVFRQFCRSFFLEFRVILHGLLKSKTKIKRVEKSMKKCIEVVLNLIKTKPQKMCLKQVETGFTSIKMKTGFFRALPKKKRSLCLPPLHSRVTPKKWVFKPGIFGTPPKKNGRFPLEEFFFWRLLFQPVFFCITFRPFLVATPLLFLFL